MFNGLMSGVNAKLADVTAGTDLDTFITSIKGGLSDLSIGNLGKVLLAGVGVAVPLVLAWFGYRWVKRKAMSAITKGRL